MEKFLNGLVLPHYRAEEKGLGPSELINTAFVLWVVYYCFRSIVQVRDRKISRS